jgi:hypothetical protein
MRAGMLDIEGRFPSASSVTVSRNANCIVDLLRVDPRPIEVLVMHWNNDDLISISSSSVLTQIFTDLLVRAVLIEIRIILFSGGAENEVSRHLREFLVELGYREWRDFAILSEVDPLRAIRWDRFDGVPEDPPSCILEVVCGGVEETRASLWLLLSSGVATLSDARELLRGFTGLLADASPGEPTEIGTFVSRARDILLDDGNKEAEQAWEALKVELVSRRCQ